MLTGILKPHGIRTTYLNINSTMDTQWETSAHNPANFQVILPNSVRTNRVWKISPHTLIVPRMFPNIYAPDNVLVWYQRPIIDIPTGAPDTYLRTVDEKWVVTKTLEFPPGLWNQTRILNYINAFTGVNEVWSFDLDSQSFVFTVTPTAPPVVFGEFVQFPHIPPTGYANMTYVTEPLGTHILDPLGLERQASNLSSLPLSPVLDQKTPATFDNVLGSNLSMRNVYPQFDRTLHNYTSWATLPFSSPPNNVPNLAGPSVVHVAITDIGDSSTVDALSGLTLDVITSINLGDVDFGVFKERLVNDIDGEAVEFQQARNIANFRVSLTDARNRQLVLPRNFPVFIKLQMVHSSD